MLVEAERLGHSGLSERMFAKPMPPLPQWNTNSVVGSLDGDGSGDHDQPYRFGLRPRAIAPYPFNTREYARLLVLRGRVQDHLRATLELVGTRGSAVRRAPAV